MAEEEKQLCKVPGCGGVASDDREGYCHGHWAEKQQHIRHIVDQTRKEMEQGCNWMMRPPR